MARWGTAGFELSGDDGGCCPCSTAGVSTHSTMASRRIGTIRRGYHPLSPPLGGDTDVARAAQQAVVLEAALAAAVRHGNDVVGLPARPGGPPAFARRALARRRRRDRSPAPAADRLPVRAPLRDAPLIGADDPCPPGAHTCVYRRLGRPAAA